MEINTKCQVFTPDAIVKQLLDIVGYKKNIFGKKVAENSCGDGNILVEIVKRYIQDGLKQNHSIFMIKKGLESDIYGAEIDANHRNNSIQRLDDIAREYDIKDVKWNIYNGDFLKQEIRHKFRFVIGNPPYITYKEMTIEERSSLRNHFQTCIYGKFDMCYAFTEASINSLDQAGKLAYLVPSNVFKNHFADSLRTMLLTGLTDIYDFKNQKLFDSKLTASAIIVYNAGKDTKKVKYHNIIEGTKIEIPKTSLIGKWQFTEINSQQKQNHTRFGDVFHTASSIATLLNEVYIIDKFSDLGECIQVGECKIEKELLRTAISPRSKKYNKTEFVIFPYYYEDAKLMRYSDQEFEKKYPLGAYYLNQYQEKLSKRDSDKGSSWFEYGRSQALAHLNQNKLLISTIITDKVKTYLLNNDEIPTSGLYITPKAEYGLDVAKQILYTDEFLNYVKSIGVVANGNSFRVSPKDINNFTFESELLT